MDVLRRQERLWAQLEVQLRERTAGLFAGADEGNPLSGDRVLDDITCLDHVRKLQESAQLVQDLLPPALTCAARAGLGSRTQTEPAKRSTGVPSGSRTTAYRMPHGASKASRRPPTMVSTWPS